MHGSLDIWLTPKGYQNRSICQWFWRRFMEWKGVEKQRKCKPKPELNRITIFSRNLRSSYKLNMSREGTRRKITHISSTLYTSLTVVSVVCFSVVHTSVVCISDSSSPETSTVDFPEPALITICWKCFG